MHLTPPVHDEQTFNLWLNAFEFHRDRDKRATLTKALGGELDDLALLVCRIIKEKGY